MSWYRIWCKNNEPLAGDSTLQERNPILDLVRGLAALAVVLGHIRPLLFVDYSELVAPSLPLKLFYYITGFASQAVVVFFVLSGYLIGGAVLSACEAGFWQGYLVRRLSRLWVVLIPCLLATWILNIIGYETGGAAFLSGNLGRTLQMAPPTPGALNALTLLGNVFFLQTITVPIFGDNRPLWSLANEFWYYMLFPLLFRALYSKFDGSLMKRGLCLVLALAIGWGMPSEMRMGFLVWCIGVGVFVLVRRCTPTRAIQFAVGGVALVVCGWVFHSSRVAELPKLWLGFAFGTVLFFAIRWRLPFAWLARTAEGLSDISYTLYLSHFSLMAFVWYTFLGAKRVQPTIGNFMTYVGLSGLLLVYAYGLYWVFERNTHLVRKWMQDRVASLLGKAD